MENISTKLGEFDIYVWGCCDRGKRIREFLMHQELKVVSFIDSKYGADMFCETTVLRPNAIKLDEKSCIIIAAVTQRVTDEIISLINKNNNIHGKFITNFDFHKYERITLLDNYLEYNWKKKNYCSDIQQWFNHFLDEVKFWRFSVADNNGDWHYTYRKKFEKKEFKCQRLSQKPSINDVVIDVGCGICSPYGHYINGEKMQLITVDPLACFYNQINQRFLNDLTEQEELSLVRFGMFEVLSSMFGKNYCDYILVDNAIDHCINPLQALIECVNTVKVGGCVSLQHHTDEAFRENYHGLHQWNVSLNENKEMCFWNDSNVININKEIGDSVAIEAWEERGNPEYSPYGVTVCNIIKRRNIDNDNITINWMGNLINCMMDKMSDVGYATEMIRSLY